MVHRVAALALSTLVLGGCAAGPAPCTADASRLGPLRTRWTRRFGSERDQHATAVTTGPDGSIFVGGFFEGELTAREAGIDAGAQPRRPSVASPDVAVGPPGPGEALGAGRAEPRSTGPDAAAAASGSDAFVKRMGPDGTSRWTRTFGGAGSQWINDLAVDAAGNVVAVGLLDGSADLGFGVETSAGDEDILVVSLDGDGKSRWSRRVGGPDNQRAHGVAVDAQGNVFVVGELHGTVTIDGVTLEDTGAGDVWVVVFAPDGRLRWTRRYGDAGAQIGADVALDGRGNVFVVAWGDGGVDFGAGERSAGASTAGFLAKLAPDGRELWSRVVGEHTWVDLGRVYLHGAAATPDGGLVVGGSFTGRANLGGRTLSAGDHGDAVVAAYDRNGGHVFSSPIGGDAGGATALSVAPGAGGHVFAAGFFDGTLDLCSGPMPSAGLRDAFVVELDGSGAFVAGRAFGDEDDQLGQAIATAPGGALALVGFGAGGLPDATPRRGKPAEPTDALPDYDAFVTLLSR